MNSPRAGMPEVISFLEEYFRFTDRGIVSRNELEFQFLQRYPEHKKERQFIRYSITRYLTDKKFLRVSGGIDGSRNSAYRINVSV